MTRSYWISAGIVAAALAVAASVTIVRSQDDVPVVYAEASGQAPDASTGTTIVEAPGPAPTDHAPPTAAPSAAAAGGSSDGLPAPSSTSPAGRDPAAPPATDAPPRSYPVLVTSYTFVDATRSTPGRSSTRSLPVVVRMPNVAGSFPLVVFGHGYAAQSGDYAPLLTELAAAGFVVASPEFPLTSTAVSSYVNEGDVLNQPADLSFVTTQLLAERNRNGPLAGKIDSSQIAVMGHSDGALTAAAAAYNSCCRDQRFTAAVLLSGQASGFGNVWFPRGSPPMLAIHGTADSINPFERSEELYASAPSPRFLVSVLGGEHLDAFLADTTRPAVVQVIADFLRAELSHDAAAGRRLPSEGTVPGVLEMRYS